jgi:hypothetical protein
LAGANGGRISAWTAADDDQIVGHFFHFTSLLQ